MIKTWPDVDYATRQTHMHRAEQLWMKTDAHG